MYQFTNYSKVWKMPNTETCLLDTCDDRQKQSTSQRLPNSGPNHLQYLPPTTVNQTTKKSCNLEVFNQRWFYYREYVIHPKHADEMEISVDHDQTPPSDHDLGLQYLPRPVFRSSDFMPLDSRNNGPVYKTIFVRTKSLSDYGPDQIWLCKRYLSIPKIWSGVRTKAGPAHVQGHVQ